MPKTSFVQLKRELRKRYADTGEPISDRTAHRLAQGIMLSEFSTETQRSAPVEKIALTYADTTGENAVLNVVLEQYLADYRARREAEACCV